MAFTPIDSQRSMAPTISSGLPIAAAVQSIVEREGEIAALVRALPDTHDKETERRLEFLARFFAAARDDEKFVARLERKCIG